MVGFLLAHSGLQGITFPLTVCGVPPPSPANTATTLCLQRVQSSFRHRHPVAPSLEVDRIVWPWYTVVCEWCIIACKLVKVACHQATGV